MRWYMLVRGLFALHYRGLAIQAEQKQVRGVRQDEAQEYSRQALESKPRGLPPA